MAASTSAPDGEPRKPSTPNKLERLENDIEELCRSMRNNEVSEQDLQEHFLDFSLEQLKLVVGRMQKSRKLQIKVDDQPKGNFLRLRDPMIARKLAAIEDDDEIRTYEAIEAVGSKGIPSRVIKYKTRLAVTRIAKTLTSLEGKQLIKAVKLQKNTQHVKSYILFHLKLDDQAAQSSVFGDGTNFDTQLFDMVSKLCTVCLRNRMKEFVTKKTSSEATAAQILENVLQTGAVKTDLVVESIEAVMKMLELNGKVERREYPDQENGSVARYRLHVVKNDRPEAAIPCIGCPVRNVCSLDSPVNPVDCPHWEAWLKKVDF